MYTNKKTLPLPTKHTHTQPAHTHTQHAEAQARFGVHHHIARTPHCYTSPSLAPEALCTHSTSTSRSSCHMMTATPPKLQSPKGTRAAHITSPPPRRTKLFVSVKPAIVKPGTEGRYEPHAAQHRMLVVANTTQGGSTRNSSGGAGAPTVVCGFCSDVVMPPVLHHCQVLAAAERGCTSSRFRVIAAQAALLRLCREQVHSTSIKHHSKCQHSTSNTAHHSTTPYHLDQQEHVTCCCAAQPPPPPPCATLSSHSTTTGTN